jgi:Flp pilus assembly CpaE family ATPase
LNFAALDGLFELFSIHYDWILIDFPAIWYSWTPKILAASQGTIVTGINSIPGLRQVAETLTAIRNSEGSSTEISVAMNKCERGAFGRVLRRQHVESILKREKIFYIRNEPMSLESINTGTPIALSGPRRAFSKDIASITNFCAALKTEKLV